MTEVVLGGRRFKPQPSRLLGSGGEADVYDIGSGLALKLYKGPDHPDYRGLADEQRAARERLSSRARKLRDFPGSLPSRVVAPIETATDRSGRFVGYSMKAVGQAEPLLRWADPAFRRAVPPAAAAPLLLDLHSTVARLHELGVVIGDFNDLNVLVSGGLSYLIDADSFQFGAHACRAFTERFVDPLACEPAALRLAAAYDPATDWYAYDVLVFQSLLLVHPFGGTFPGKGKHSERVLGRLSVFDPKVRYPKAALPWRALPDELLHRFHGTFVEDKRTAFPRALLDTLRWSACARCGAPHARHACPACERAAPQVRRLSVTVRGTVTATTLLETRGEVVAVSPGGWLVYEAGEFKREDGTVALRGPLRPGTRYFLDGKKTLSAGASEAFAHADGRSYWERDGALWRQGSLGEERFGEVLAGQTRLWAGPAFGFGFYRAGGLTVAFTFDPHRRGLADGLRLPAIAGRVLDADCVFGTNTAWLLLLLEAGGRLWRRCVALRKDGTVLACVDEPAWLESLHGACAAGDWLFVPTDRGIVRVDATLSRTSEYAETEPFVDASTRLAAAEDGLLCANRREVLKLTVKQEALP